MRKIRVAVVEDNRILRERIVLMMKNQKDIDLLVASGNWEQVLLRARKFRSLIVIVEFGQHDTFAMLESLKALAEAKVIVTGVVAAQANILELVKAGVGGFVLKEATFSHLLRTVRLVARGVKVLPRAMIEPLFGQIAESGAVRTPLGTSDGRITKREREIISLIRQGMSNKEISQRLHIATYTVKSHVHNVLDKLDLRNRLQLMAHTGNTASPGNSSAINPPMA